MTSHKLSQETVAKASEFLRKLNEVRQHASEFLNDSSFSNLRQRIRKLKKLNDLEHKNKTGSTSRSK